LILTLKLGKKGLFSKVSKYIHDIAGLKQSARKRISPCPLYSVFFILEQRKQDLAKVSGMDDMFTFWLAISENLKDVDYYIITI